MKRGMISVYIIGAMVVVSLICLALIVVSCNRACKPPKPPRTTKLGPYKVVSVESGASLTVNTARRDRREAKGIGNEPCILEYVTAPSDTLAEASRQNLVKLAGDAIYVERTRRSRLGISSDESDKRRLEFQAWYVKHYKRCEVCWAGGGSTFCEEAQEKSDSIDGDLVDETDDDALGAGGPRQPLIGIVSGAGGENLALAQLRDGLVRCAENAPKEYLAAQKEAQKAKRGVWKPDSKRRWWKLGTGRDDLDSRFEEWFGGHVRTCQQCRDSMTDDPDMPLCGQAFDKMKELLCPPAADTPKPPIPQPPDDVPELPTKPPVIQSTCEPEETPGRAVATEELRPEAKP